MIVQAMIETINGCKILLRGKGLTDKERQVLESMDKEDLELHVDSVTLEVELQSLQRLSLGDLGLS
jgi:hypothetical protein